MARVMVSVPSFDRSIKSATAEAIGNLDSAGHELVHRYIGGYDVARARNQMAQAAVDGGFDYLLMVDSDMLPPPDGFANLMEHDLSVCCGWAVRGASDDGTTSVIKFGGQGYHSGYKAHELARMAEEGSGPIRVKGNGMAFALVSTEVFGRIRKPWFKFVEHADGSALGEDFYFCKMCSEVGLDIWVDPRVGCGHIHDRVLEAM